MPIIVGGTHYYTQSLLFHDSLAVEDGEEPPSPKHDQAPNTEGHERHIDDQYPVLQAPTQDMLEKLREVDPIMAARWHPNDRRKIRRSLEIYYKTGRRASELYGEQQVRKQGTNGAGANLEEGSPVDGYTSQGGLEGPATGLRYPTLFLWMHTPRDMLKDRIRSRVDKMIDEGLFDEAACLRRFAAESEEAGQAIDFSRGVFISIGYKECLPYLSALHDPEAEDKTLVRLREEAVEKTKTATWQYAKYQERWIRIKLLRAIKQAGAEEYLQVLNIGRPEDWDTEVSGPAVDAVRAFLDGDSNRLQSTETSAVHEALTALEKIDAHGGAMPQAQTCELCNVTATTTQEWSKHVNSNRHRKTVKAKQKRSHMLLETVP